MWVKMTEEEIRATKQTRWKSVMRFCLVGGCFMVFFVLFEPRNSPRYGYVRPLEDLKIWVPSMFAVGASLGLFAYFVPKERRKLSCLECGATTLAGGLATCACGGKFEDIRRHRWIEKPNNTSEGIRHPADGAAKPSR
jgi:hypothetical protein